MELSPFVTVENRCTETVTVHIRVLRPKKGPPPPFPKRIKIKPQHQSPPLPYALVVGTPSWRILQGLTASRSSELVSFPGSTT